MVHVKALHSHRVVIFYGFIQFSHTFFASYFRGKQLPHLCSVVPLLIRGPLNLHVSLQCQHFLEVAFSRVLKFQLLSCLVNRAKPRTCDFYLGSGQFRSTKRPQGSICGVRYVA
jgi:hypothetical protein